MLNNSYQFNEIKWKQPWCILTPELQAARLGVQMSIYTTRKCSSLLTIYCIKLHVTVRSGYIKRKSRKLITMFCLCLRFFKSVQSINHFGPFVLHPVWLRDVTTAVHLPCDVTNKQTMQRPLHAFF